MLPDRVSNPGPLTCEPGALPTALCGPAEKISCSAELSMEFFFVTSGPVSWSTYTSRVYLSYPGTCLSKYLWSLGICQHFFFLLFLFFLFFLIFLFSLFPCLFLIAFCLKVKEKIYRIIQKWLFYMNFIKRDLVCHLQSKCFPFEGFQRHRIKPSNHLLFF